MKDTATNDGFTGTLELRFGNFQSKIASGFTNANFIDILHKKNSGNYAALEMLIRPGDHLHFRCFDNSNQCLEKSGLHNDTLFVTILRKGKVLLSDFTLDLDISFNNSARSMRK